MIYASNFMPSCVRDRIYFEATGDAFELQTLEINSDQVGERCTLWRWPALMTLQYGKADAALKIDAVELSPGSFNQLHNSLFKGGLIQ